MTAPLTAYQQEMAKRGLSMPKATGCPRRAVRSEPRTYVPVETMTRRDRQYTARSARWAEWRKLYERDGLLLVEIAALTGYSHQGVAHALNKMGVRMNARGGGVARSTLSRQLSILRKENAVMRARILSLREKLAKLEVAT